MQCILKEAQRNESRKIKQINTYKSAVFEFELIQREDFSLDDAFSSLNKCALFRYAKR